MKKIFSSTIVAMTILFAVSAFAGDRTITLKSPTVVGGQKLAAGDYKVEYQVNGAMADVHFFKGKKEVASTSAQVTELAAVPRRDAFVTGTDGDGTSRLLQLQFANKKSAITFEKINSSAGN